MKKSCFFHIPKTAGNTINAILHPDYAPGHQPFNKAKAHFQRRAHSVAQKKKVKPDTWESVFKFSIVRNPWDRMFSHWCHEDGLERVYPDFEKWLLTCTVSKFERQTPAKMLLNDAGECELNFVGQFEFLEQDVQFIAEKLGKGPIKMRYLNRTDHRPEGHYSTFYTQEMRELVEGHSLWEIERFGYTFEEES